LEIQNSKPVYPLERMKGERIKLFTNVGNKQGKKKSKALQQRSQGERRGTNNPIPEHREIKVKRGSKIVQGEGKGKGIRKNVFF